MDLSFYPLTLEAVDEAAAESLCLFIAEDERPLTGLAGLADWRLSGRLSRLLRSGLLTGDAGEAVLTPPGARLAFQKLFLFGLGKLGQSDEQLQERLAEALRKLAQAGVQEAALQLPSRLAPEVGVRTLIDGLQGPGRALVFAQDPQKLVTALSQAASRGQAQLERRVVKVPTPASPVKPVSPAVRPGQRLQPTPPQGAPVVKPAAQAVPPAQAIPVAPAVPKASPLPFAPRSDAPPQELPPLTPPPPLMTPKAAPLPFAPVAEPLPTGPTPQAEQAASPAEPLPSASDVEAGPAPAQSEEAAPAEAPELPAEEKRPALPPSQRYVPPPAKPSVFTSGKGKKKR